MNESDTLIVRHRDGIEELYFVVTDDAELAMGNSIESSHLILTNKEAKALRDFLNRTVHD